MPTQKPRITVVLDEEIYQKMIDVMNKNGILEKSTFVQKAILYYLTNLDTDEFAKSIITKEASNEMKRNLNPLSKELGDRDRVMQIQIDAIWKKLFLDNPNDISDVEKIIRQSINDVDENNGMKINNILSSASSAMEISENSDSRKTETYNLRNEKSINQNLEKVNSEYLENDDVLENQNQKSENFSTNQESENQNSEMIKQENIFENGYDSEPDTPKSNSPFGQWGMDIFAESKKR